MTWIYGNNIKNLVCDKITYEIFQILLRFYTNANYKMKIYIIWCKKGFKKFNGMRAVNIYNQSVFKTYYNLIIDNKILDNLGNVWIIILFIKQHIHIFWIQITLINGFHFVRSVLYLLVILFIVYIIFSGIWG